MISLSLTQILGMYIILFLAAILFAWIYYVLVRHRNDRRRRGDRVRCGLCACEFESPPSESVDSVPDGLCRCPRCGTLNERFGVERIR